MLERESKLISNTTRNSEPRSVSNFFCIYIFWWNWIGNWVEGENVETESRCWELPKRVSPFWAMSSTSHSLSPSGQTLGLEAKWPREMGKAWLNIIFYILWQNYYDDESFNILKGYNAMFPGLSSPLTFLTFHFVYWTILINVSERPTDDLMPLKEEWKKTSSFKAMN